MQALWSDSLLAVRLESPLAMSLQQGFQDFAVGINKSIGIGFLRIVAMLLKDVSVASGASY